MPSIEESAYENGVSSPASDRQVIDVDVTDKAVNGGIHGTGLGVYGRRADKDGNEEA